MQSSAVNRLAWPDRRLSDKICALSAP